MNKSPDAFRTISEVAEDLDIPQHVLRFWETRFTPIRPLKRGGGRRYYRPDDVDLLKGIRQLLYGQGYTIKGVQRILKEDGPRFVQGIGRGEHALEPSRRTADADGGLDDSVQDQASAFEAGREAVREAARGEPSAPPFGQPVDRAAQGSASLSRDDLDRLRTALDEMLECARVLEALKRIE